MKNFPNLKEGKMIQYFLKFGYYSYDSDSYEKDIFEIEFVSHEELKEFYEGFKKLPIIDDPYLTAYFGNYVEMEVFGNYYKSMRNYSWWIDTGGVSTEHIHAFIVDTREIPFK